MSAWDDALVLCEDLRSATVDFTAITYERIANRYRFHLDKLRVGPEPTNELEEIGGYPAKLLDFVRVLGGRTLNSSCYFGPRVFLRELCNRNHFRAVYVDNLRVTRQDIRVIGGDHGEGRWVLLTKSGGVFFMEIDDDYQGRVPEPCFTSFTSWLRVNFILGVVETELERAGEDYHFSSPATFRRSLLAELSKIEPRLTADTWPYRLLYRLDDGGRAAR